MKKYSVEYFIDKFRKIPSNEWCVGTFIEGNKKCALGHCGIGNAKNPTMEIKETREARYLEGYFYNYLDTSVELVNDNKNENYSELGKYPKTRIINALKQIKKEIKRKMKSLHKISWQDRVKKRDRVLQIIPALIASNDFQYEMSKTELNRVIDSILKTAVLIVKEVDNHFELNEESYYE